MGHQPPTYSSTSSPPSPSPSIPSHQAHHHQKTDHSALAQPPTEPCRPAPHPAHHKQCHPSPPITIGPPTPQQTPNQSADPPQLFHPAQHPLQPITSPRSLSPIPQPVMHSSCDSDHQPCRTRAVGPHKGQGRPRVLSLSCHSSRPWCMHAIQGWAVTNYPSRGC